MRVIEEERNTALVSRVQGWQAEAALAGMDLWFRAVRLGVWRRYCMSILLDTLHLPFTKPNDMSHALNSGCWREGAEVSEDLECYATQKLCLTD